MNNYVLLSCQSIFSRITAVDNCTGYHNLYVHVISTGCTFQVVALTVVASQGLAEKKQQQIPEGDVDATCICLVTLVKCSLAI